MRVALVQLAAETDKTANLATVGRLVADAARHDPDLVVLPEASMHDFGRPEDSLAPVAEPLDGPFVSALADLAVKHSTYLVAGVIERGDDPSRPYNTLVALGPDGAEAGRYRKLHLYDSFGFAESDKLAPGGDPGAAVAGRIDVGGVGVAMLTCYDVRFPELARVLVDAGADVLCVPSAWVRGPLKESHWDTLLRARAIENTVYVAAAAQCGRKYCGLSTLVDPMGVTVSALGEAEGVTVGEVSSDRVTQVRGTNPALRHRRFHVRPGPG